MKIKEKIKIFLRNIYLKLADKFFRRRSVFIRNKTLLVLRLDAIGDYILFRNFLKDIRESAKFGNHKITLCGNEDWKDIAEKFDKEFVDDFIWINKNKFKRKSEWKYTTGKLWEIHKSGFETVINPNTSRSRIINYVEDRCGAKFKIKADYDLNLSFVKNGLVNSEAENKAMFQFYINKNFMELILEGKINLLKPYFDIKKEYVSEKYIMLFPGAGNPDRKWSVDNFAQLSKNIREKSNHKILICGGKDDIESAEEIIIKSGISNIKNLAGETSLSEVIRLIANAELLISNETCAVHIAASVNTNTVCISNGNHFGRFNPYPKDIFPNIKTIYPRELNISEENFLILFKKYYISSELDINKIDVMEVFELASGFSGIVSSTGDLYKDEKNK